MQVSDFDYALPKNVIAQTPHRPRDHAKLLVLGKNNGKIAHHRFFDLPILLRPTDVLVFNNSKVFKARLMGTKHTGGHIEIFLLRHLQGSQWLSLVRGNAKPHASITIRDRVTVELVKQRSEGEWVVEVETHGRDVFQILERFGRVPLPPYIHASSPLSHYQTVYAKHRGSVAAPTAGLHFTHRLLQKLQTFGIATEFVTLHVGLGTFQPVTSKRVEDHVIHSELAEISDATCQRLNAYHKQGRRIIAVGTTSVRTLEAFSDRNGVLNSGCRDVNLFIYPGYSFRIVSGMITNFHLPKSSLLMLVSAFAGRTSILHAYDLAIQQNYRFFSFGDAMLIL
ncbi:MAG: tRNA preQ1(34) S-adenosylmethionine ribosyltransferase-isomerase QueA [Candidatus Kerfeldbacteria bacterium]|nr:tRNA preQ1(34) S-adenosylmethionine ribosyltransferase-isomerase QueA [Candidatus Kerfeldbacteria bacterium]